ncbi:MAG TPA: bifunctional phosphoribosylaminoimidazolecarboxamide formyltransferase/IMP cyclohydrolase [Nitrososphaerales archaeon]|nr:bifunctional phosphoribosylaminoimidazolecarboxamide formyltransferase/IMP cyclohydrolase [Nitrososphaerales archaeon]
MPAGLQKIQTALVSVSDKTGLADFGATLTKYGVEMLASGGTYAALKERGVAVKSLQDDMKLPTALSGRVKTLHAPLHASILARRTSEHLKELEAMGVKPIDMVVCNFYPFSDTLRKEGSVDEKLVESIDIGGPAMVRAASKNFENVTVVPSPGFYGPVADELSKNDGATTLAFRRRLAIEAFSVTSAYDAAIFNGLRGNPSEFPERLLVSALKVNDAKYGENPDRKAVIYSIDGWTTMSSWKQLAGDTLSFNNYLDVGSAYDIVEGYGESSAVATVKHGQISGFAFAPTVSEAYSLAHSCDPEADFGGTVIANREVDMDAARLIGRNEGAKDGSVYTEIVIAPGFSGEALALLQKKQKKKIRLIKTTARPEYPYDLKVIEGVILAQDSVDYRVLLDPSKATVPTKSKPDPMQFKKLLAAWEVVRKVQSNGIVIANGNFDGERLTRFWTLGVGSFRKRNGAVKIALDNAGARAKGAVCASDGFFPFRDSIDLLGAAAVSAVIQPGGSANDAASIEAADQYGMAMVFTHTRAFKH